MALKLRFPYFSSPDSSSLYYSSSTIRLHNYSSPLLFISTTIRLHYFSSPLLFVSTQFVSNNSSPLLFVSRQLVSLRFVSNISSPLLFVSTSNTIRLHYYSSPLLFVSTTIRLQQFVPTTIRINYNSIIHSLVDVINNTGKKRYSGSFVSK